MEGSQEVGIGSSEFSELLKLVSQDGEHESGVEFGVAGVPGLEPSVLIVLDQAVVGVARKGKRIEPKSVDRRLGQDPQARICFSKMGQIVLDHIVTEHKLRAGGIVIQRAQSAREVSAA